jgi:hypothetical protein
MVFQSEVTDPRRKPRACHRLFEGEQMTNSTNDIREYNRDQWTLDDLRQIVTDTTGWDGSTPVQLTAPEPQTRRGTIEVVGQE